MPVIDLATMLQGITEESIPGEARQKAIQCSQDMAGVFLGGKNLPEGQQVHQALAGASGTIGEPGALALWIGSVTRLLDFDDGHRRAMGHPGVPILSSAIALAKTVDFPGKKFIQAITRGYEAYGYIGRVVNPKAYLERGFDATGICGAVGSAATAGTILGLCTEELGNAISIAGSLCGGLNQYAIDGGSPKFLCAGWAAKLGITAAQLAKAGLDGPSDIFRGRKGFCQGFAVEYDPELLNDYRIHWEILNVYLKRFACVRRLHASLDIVDRIVGENALTADRIERIDVYGSAFIAESAKYAPKDLTLAQTSMPYAIAILLKYGAVTMELLKENLGNQDIRRLAEKVVITEEEAFNEILKKDKGLWGAARIDLRTKDGETFTEERHYALGERENPLPENALREKFMGLASRSLGPNAAREIYEGLADLENLETARTLASKII
ncbi:MAG: MmgE/PrpD family protein [Synergistales bacterium]|jgi:2-methylcitrate dehydratase PrpD